MLPAENFNYFLIASMHIRGAFIAAIIVIWIAKNLIKYLYRLHLELLRNIFVFVNINYVPRFFGRAF